MKFSAVLLGFVVAVPAIAQENSWSLRPLKLEYVPPVQSILSTGYLLPGSWLKTDRFSMLKDVEIDLSFNRTYSFKVVRGQFERYLERFGLNARFGRSEVEFSTGSSKSGHSTSLGFGISW